MSSAMLCWTLGEDFLLCSSKLVIPAVAGRNFLQANNDFSQRIWYVQRRQKRGSNHSSFSCKHMIGMNIEVRGVYEGDK